MSIQKTRKRFLTGIGALLIAVAMLVMMLPTSIFAADNPAVTAAGNGVFQVNMIYRDDDNNEVPLIYGSGFLINTDTLVTCFHVVNLTPADIEVLKTKYGKSEQEIKDRISYSVTVRRDVYVKVSQIITQSLEMDFAVLKLEQSIQNRTPLAIRPSSDVKQTEKVYAVGFPQPSAIMQETNTFTSDDVTITEGIVNKIATGPNIAAAEYGIDANYDYIQTSTNLNGGNSGGPMVDENGNVVGICQSTFDGGYFNAIAIDQAVNILNDLGIEFTKAGDAPAAPGGAVEEPTTEAAAPAEVKKDALDKAVSDAKAIDAKAYTEDSYKAVTAALDKAVALQGKDDATQEEVDAAAAALNQSIKGLAEKPKGLDLKWIIIIAAAVVVIAAVIIIIVVLTNKKKKAQQPKPIGGGVGTTPIKPQPPIAGSGMPQTPPGFNPSPMMPVGGDDGATTVLSSDAGETTVLAQNVNGGTLTNVKTGDRVQVNTAEFTIGRERSRVNYCISGNTNVGRVHAKITVRNGQAFLVDLKATNGTFVNGVKCTPMQEVQLKSGDKIAFANEEYTYQA